MISHYKVIEKIGLRVLLVCFLICHLAGYLLGQCEVVTGSTAPLYWDANSEPNIAYYNVYRSPTSGSGYSVIGTTAQGPDPISFTDMTSLSTGYYVVTAVNTSGLGSGFSNEVCVQLSGGGVPPDYTLDQITTLLTDGFRPQWSPDGEWIAYDHLESDGYCDVYRVRPDGTENECLTCGRLEVPKNGGAPSYHPSGRFLAFTAEKEEHGSVPPDTNPGAGIYNDVMLLDFETGNIYRLTDVRDGESPPPPEEVST